jgi:hypothetical protein
MERRLLITLSGLTLPIILGLSPIALAQTPEPAAGNPAINSMPTPSSGDQVQSGQPQNQNNLAPSDVPAMASPSSEAAIPKGSNPDSGSGNMAAGSGAMPAPTDNMSNQGSITNPQTATSPEAGNADRSPANDSAPMPQGRYTSPPTDPK